MALLKLHTRINPERLVLQERTEIAAVDAYLDGSAIYSKGGVQLHVQGNTRGHSKHDGGETMNKLTALSKLANAFHYLKDQDRHEGMNVLAHKFGYLRRSLRIEDLMPVKCVEGYNGRCPRSCKGDRMAEVVIIGEQIAGRAASVRKQLKDLTS